MEAGKLQRFRQKKDGNISDSLTCFRAAYSAQCWASETSHFNGPPIPNDTHVPCRFTGRDSQTLVLGRVSADKNRAELAIMTWIES